MGELHDHKFGSVSLSAQWYSRHNVQAGWMLDSCLIVVGVYSLVLRPLHLLPAPSADARRPYERATLQPRPAVQWALGLRDEGGSQSQSAWRVYENLHLFFWLGNDSAWCHFDTGNTPIQQAAMWILFAVPTVMMSVDFFLLSLFAPGCIIEHAHFTASMLWVSANIAWAAGELWGDAYHDAAVGWIGGPLPSGKTSGETSGESYAHYVLHSGRWWGAWLCIAALVPVVTLYAIWWGAPVLQRHKAHQEAQCEEETDLKAPLLHMGDG